ncbi:hepatocyte cell adhesion molecule-like [Myxocyprinus asiaticus]|uniref:hepatocyte cell adhesion molecule-like n=1 Tax=Myxocyprinus asiaticus TaxID=70543 RepID=UPI002223925D|nr:hepatocyte cell adhesion molecule-like [Myxocyprinus asiaticus]
MKFNCLFLLTNSDVLRENMVPVLLFLRLWLWHLDGVFGVDTDKVKSVSVMEGDSVTLHTDVTEILRDDDVIEWMFGAQNPDTVIAEINRPANIISIMDEQFRFRLQLNNQTGDLTITNIRTTDTGLYKVEIIINTTPVKIFNVTVYALLPIPVITSNSSQCSSSSKCVLVCSVVNVTQVTLSWYKGNSLFSSISVSDLNSSLSLPLEVEYQENNIYSCVINNPIRNQTQHLNITEVCQPCSSELSVSLIVLISTAAETLLIVAAVLMFCICRKCRKTHKEVQTCGEEITYADPTFYKRKAQKAKVQEADEVVYAGLMR